VNETRAHAGADNREVQALAEQSMAIQIRLSDEVHRLTIEARVVELNGGHGSARRLRAVAERLGAMRETVAEATDCVSRRIDGSHPDFQPSMIA
jgi:hypothetical protein